MEETGAGGESEEIGAGGEPEETGAGGESEEIGAEGEPEETETPDVQGQKWYIIHTYSGYEQTAKSSLETRVAAMGKEDQITEVLVPAEKVVEMVKGEKRTSMRKFFPGYILVKMNLTKDTWHIVKETPKVTGFVGGSTNPPALSDKEVKEIMHQMEDGSVKPKPKVSFEKGDNVSVNDGPFATFTGYVDEVYPDKGKVKVMVSIFGRPTPVELEFFQVKKG